MGGIRSALGGHSGGPLSGAMDSLRGLVAEIPDLKKLSVALDLVS